MQSKTMQISMLTAMASVLFSFETLIQSPFPWMRLGLANIITLMALIWWGVREAVLIVILRVCIGSFVVGRFMTPTFVLSMSGGLAAALSMGVLVRYARHWFSVIGISLTGALIHNVIQLVLVYTLYIRQIQIFSLLSLFLLSSAVSGVLIGFLSSLLLIKLPDPGMIGKFR